MRADGNSSGAEYVLIPRATLDAIVAGKVTLAFRRWQRPTVKAGGTLRTAVGVLAIAAVDTVTPRAISERDARAAGAASKVALLAALAGREGTLYRIRLRHLGADPRIALRKTRATGRARDALEAKLAGLDARSAHGPWTRTVLRLIAERPAVRAPDLAASLGRETLPFKADVRKLKNLGLTESLDVGYRLSPRGRALLGRRR